MMQMQRFDGTAEQRKQRNRQIKYAFKSRTTLDCRKLKNILSTTPMAAAGPGPGYGPGQDISVL